MSTRATYNLDGLYYYVHHDNYPSGAACYFEKMLAMSGYSYGDRFLQAMQALGKKAEPILNHDPHYGDTDYVYDLLFGSILVVREKQYNENYKWSYSLFFQGTLKDFIAQYKNQEVSDCLSKNLAPSQPVETFYTILWYEDGGSCWCEDCVYNEGMAFNSAEEAERYAEEKINTTDYVREYRIQKVSLPVSVTEKVSL